MKSAIFVVFCAVTFFVSADQVSTDQTSEFMDECADLTGIDKGNLESHRHHRKADAKKPTKAQEVCFETCMMTKLGYLDEVGKISDKLIQQNSEPGKFEETKQKAETVYEKCKATSDFDICKQWACMKDEGERLPLFVEKKTVD